MSAWSLSMHSLMLDYGVAADFVAYDLVLVWLGPSMLTCCTSPGLHVPLQRKASFNFQGDRTKNISEIPTLKGRRGKQIASKLGKA